MNTPMVPLEPEQQDQLHQSPFYRKFLAIIRQHNHRAADGSRKVSFETMEKRERILINGFKTLIYELGYKLRDPANLKTRHIEALAKHWETRGLSASTIQMGLSAFRVFCGWIGKGGMIREPEKYVTDPDSVKRTYKAQYDHSWTSANIDYQAVAQRAAEIEPRCAIYIKLAVMFGMRKLETLSLRPHVADRGDHLYLTDGTKGGRPRIVPIRTPEQRALIDECKTLAPTKESHIGMPGYDKKSGLRRLENVLTSIGITRAEQGVTLHGLRHQYINDRLEELGLKSKVRGGNAKAQKAKDPAGVQRAMQTVSEEVGHARPQIVTCYSGG